MHQTNTFRFVLASLLGLTIFTAQAATWVDETATVTKVGASIQVPAPHLFTISTAGTYRVSLVDLGVGQLPPYRPALMPKLLITQGFAVMARLDATGVRDVVLPTGDYSLRLSGKAQAGFIAQVAASVSQGATQIAEHSVGFVSDSPVDPNRSTLETDFAVGTAGTYTVELNDRQFPAALAALQLIIVAPGGIPVMCLPASAACPGVTGNTFGANLGRYQLRVIGDANPTRSAGLYSIRISGGPASEVVYADTHPVGQMPASTGVVLPSTASYTLAVTDFAFPQALSEVHIALTQGSNAAVLNAPGSASISGVAGSARLYEIAKPLTATGSGSYSLRVLQGTQQILSTAKAVNAAQTTDTALNFSVTLPTSGTYQIQVRDFQFPQAFTAVRVAVTQNAVILASANSATTLSITSAASGPIDIFIAATPAASANGLLGISVTPQATSTPIWEATQAIGGLFKSRTVALAAAGRYDLSAVDAQFPAALTEFALVITRGATLIGQVYAAGGTAPTQLRIDASPGEYTVNLIATASASENYGVYGIKLEDVPAAPAPTPPPVASPATTSESGGGSMGMEALLMALFTLGLRLRFTARSSSRRD